MNHILAQTQGDFVAIQCIDKLTELDFEIITPLLQSQIEEYHKISLFVEMKDFHGWTDGGLWADTKFELKHTEISLGSRLWAIRSGRSGWRCCPNHSHQPRSAITRWSSAKVP